MPMTILSDPLIAIPTAWGLALLLFAAGWHKLRQPDAFAAVLASYGMGPAALLAPLRRLIPLAEIVLALGLLDPQTRPYSAPIVAGLLSVYGAAMAYVLWQGRRIADCGCSTGNGRSPVRAALVWRNAVLALLALTLLQAAGERSPGAYDLAAMVLATLIGGALYLLVNTLIATQHSSRDIFHV
jgi:hypothetical protein